MYVQIKDLSHDMYQIFHRHELYLLGRNVGEHNLYIWADAVYFICILNNIGSYVEGIPFKCISYKVYQIV